MIQIKAFSLDLGQLQHELHLEHGRRPDTDNMITSAPEQCITGRASVGQLAPMSDAMHIPDACLLLCGEILTY